LIYKETGGIKTLTEYKNELVYETDHAYGRFNKDNFTLLEAKAKTPCVKEIHFEQAAIMSIIMQGAKNLVFE
jgi:hypothetical protein